MLWKHLTQIAHLIDDRCWFYRGAFHFALSGDGSVTLAVSGDSMDRIRLDACIDGLVHATSWARVGDFERIAAIVAAATDETTAPASL